MRHFTLLLAILVLLAAPITARAQATLTVETYNTGSTQSFPGPSYETTICGNGGLQSAGSGVLFWAEAYGNGSTGTFDFNGQGTAGEPVTATFSCAPYSAFSATFSSVYTEATAIDVTKGTAHGNGLVADWNIGPNTLCWNEGGTVLRFNDQATVTSGCSTTCPLTVTSNSGIGITLHTQGVVWDVEQNGNTPVQQTFVFQESLPAPGQLPLPSKAWCWISSTTAQDYAIQPLVGGGNGVLCQGDCSVTCWYFAGQATCG